MSTTDLGITKDTVQARSDKPSTAKDTKGMGFGFGECGALPHAPAGEGALARPREQRTENRKQSARQARDKTIVVQRNQTSKHPSFQTSNCPCTPGTSTTCLKATQEGEQEIQEMQEIQERPCGASVKPSF